MKPAQLIRSNYFVAKHVVVVLKPLLKPSPSRLNLLSLSLSVKPIFLPHPLSPCSLVPLPLRRHPPLHRDRLSLAEARDGAAGCVPEALTDSSPPPDWPGPPGDRCHEPPGGVASEAASPIGSRLRWFTSKCLKNKSSKERGEGKTNRSVGNKQITD